MRRSFLIPVLAALAGAVVITGQSASQVNPGARVRVQVDSPPPPRTIVGTFRGLTADTISLSPSNGGAWQRIPTSSIGRLEVSTGRGIVASHVILGTLGGAFAGGLIAGATSSCAKDQWLCFQGLAIAGGVMLGGAAGAVTGLLIKGEHWKTVPLPSVAVFPVPNHGVGVAVRVEF